MNSPAEKTEPVSYRWTEGDYGEWKFANCAPDDSADLENFEPLYLAPTVEALKAENAALLSRVERMEKALADSGESVEGGGCEECGGTEMRDTGGVHPWGEHISVPCDCKERP